MRRIKFIPSAIFFLIISISATAQFTETKEITQKFAVTPETQIEITNKYGKIELNTWNKDSVVLEISIRVEERRASRLEKSMDQIDFDFTDSGHFLIARTIIGKNMSMLQREFLKFKETILQSDGSMEIDYVVWLPADNDLTVENKFGDIFIGDYQGDVKIDLSNGNLKSHDFQGDLELTFNFADATINQVKNARLDCNYSNVYIETAENLRVISKSSSFDIQELDELDTESRRDNFRISKVDLVDGQGSFSNFRIAELTDRLSLRAEYGDVDVQETAADFSSILIESKSTDINIYFPKAAAFAFEITQSDADLYLDNKLTIEEEQTIDEKDSQIELRGTYGAGDDLPEKLFITANSGEVNLFSK